MSNLLRASWGTEGSIIRVLVFPNTEFPYFPNSTCQRHELNSYRIALRLLFQAVTDSYLSQIHPSGGAGTEVSSRARAGITTICNTPLGDNPAMLVTPVEGSKISGHILTKRDRSANDMLKANHNPWREGLKNKLWSLIICSWCYQWFFGLVEVDLDSLTWALCSRTSCSIWQHLFQLGTCWKCPACCKCSSLVSHHQLSVPHRAHSGHRCF